MYRRTLIKGSLSAMVLGGAGCSSRMPSPGNGGAPSLAQLSEQLRSHQTTAEALTRHCLQLVAEIDKTGPALNAVIELNPEAISIATRLDAQQRRGPLHGLPILIKDNIDTADAMETTAGSFALMGARPERDAFLVHRLRSAGVVLLGKTNLSEWANIRSPHSTSGWSARGGLTRHPYVLDHNPSGSSSGSAVAVAAGLAAGAIGTETNGSIISPASACGIVGLKPTVGLVSGSGIIPITHWQDTAGPMTRTVRDAAMLLNGIIGIDPRSRDTGPVGPFLTDYTSLLTTGSLRGKRLGVVRALAGKHPGVLTLFEAALNDLRKAGALIVDPVELPNESQLGHLSMAAMLTEFRADLNTYLAGRGAKVRSLADLIAFNEEHRDQEMPHFGQEFFEEAERLGTPEAIAEGAQLRAKVRSLAGPEGIDAALHAHHLDALICPTNDPASKTNLAKGDADVRCCCTPAAVAGHPHLTVPMGFVGDLPVGLSFFGAAWSDALLLSLGHGFEQVRPAFSPPHFLQG